MQFDLVVIGKHCNQAGFFFEIGTSYNRPGQIEALTIATDQKQWESIKLGNIFVCILK